VWPRRLTLVSKRNGKRATSSWTRLLVLVVLETLTSHSPELEQEPSSSSSYTLGAIVRRVRRRLRVLERVDAMGVRVGPPVFPRAHFATRSLLMAESGNGGDR
jgi:hypothetical protein